MFMKIICREKKKQRHRLVILQTMYGQKKNFSTFSYKLVQFSPIMILVNSGAFLSISSWFCELTELIFVMIPLPPKNARDYGLCASSEYANFHVASQKY